MKKPAVLFTTACKPFPGKTIERDDADVFYYRNTLRQGLFQMRQEVSWHPLHFIAQNISVPSTVLENPSFRGLKNELLRGQYDILAITFTVNLVEQVLAIARMSVSVKPDIRIILGGYGTSVFLEESEIASELRKLATVVCRGEGISFFRTYLEEAWQIPQPSGPISQSLVPSGNSLFRFPVPLFRQGHVVKSLGCANGCSFCGTSSLFERKKIPLANAEGMYRAIRQIYDTCPDITSCLIYDENFLQDNVFFQEFKRLMENDIEMLSRPLSLTVFSSADTVMKYSHEELIKAGIGMIFIGVESFSSAVLKAEGLAKRESIDIKDMFRKLHNAGIGTLASLVIGWENHTPLSVLDEVEQFAALVPTFYQVVPLHAIPGTPLWKRMAALNRIVPGYRFANGSVGKSNIVHPALKPKDLDRCLDTAYSRLVEEGGPWPARLFGINLKGYLHWKDSSDPAVAARARGFRKALFVILPLAWAGRLLSAGTGFRKRFDEEAACCKKLFPVYTRLAAAAGAGLVPVLLLIRILAEIRNALLPSGDQPRTVVTRYPGTGAEP